MPSCVRELVWHGGQQPGMPVLHVLAPALEDVKGVDGARGLWGGACAAIGSVGMLAAGVCHIRNAAVRRKHNAIRLHACTTTQRSQQVVEPQCQQVSTTGPMQLSRS